MFADPKLVKRRRQKRRLKAAASVLVALAAGTFLACQRQLEKLSGTTASPSPGPADASGDAPYEVSRNAQDDAPDRRGDVRVADGNSSDAFAANTADGRSPRPVDAAVDVNEHRKGMPVPDNLLE
jgi:hypothetical protein